MGSNDVVSSSNFPHRFLLKCGPPTFSVRRCKGQSGGADLPVRHETALLGGMLGGTCSY